MKIPHFVSEYTRRQKIVSFIISLCFALIIILTMAWNLLSREETFEYNPFSAIDNRIVDDFFVKRYKNADSPPVPRDLLLNMAVIKIDDDSLGTDLFPQWPIPRSRYGELFEKLQQGGAKTIGFDVILAEQSIPEQDEKLVKALKATKKVFLPVFFYPSSENMDAENMGTETEEMDRWSAKLPYKPFYDAMKKANGPFLEPVGFVSVEIPDVIRRMPLSQTVENKTFYALGLVTVADFLGIPQDKLIDKSAEGYFLMGDTKIPMIQGEMRINYMFPPGELSYILKPNYNISHFINEFSIGDVFQMTPEDLKSAFGGKLVLIGATATGATDIRPTPFGAIPGLYSHLNVMLSLMGKRFLSVATPTYNLAVVLLMGILAGLIIPRLTPVMGALFTLMICYGYYQFSYWRFESHGIINYVSAPILCAFFSYVVINVYNTIAERKARASMSKMFKEFAPLPSPLIEKYVEESGGSAKTGGTLAHVTILFSDIRGYTDLSEKLTSQEVMGLLNEYHEAMGKVFKETGGVIFTYIGDAQLVVYGLEGVSKINHATASIKAGLMMGDAMEALQNKWQKEGKKIFEIGVGICTGELSIGVVGSEQLKQYTVIGDTVNVASRIQGMSRDLESPVLIHERTYLMARNGIEAEALRPVKLKGKKELVNVYRAKRVIGIKPYPGDEIKDLDREVAELHKRRDMAIQQAMEGRIPESGDFGDVSILTPIEEKSKGEVAPVNTDSALTDTIDKSDKTEQRE